MESKIQINSIIHFVFILLIFASNCFAQQNTFQQQEDIEKLNEILSLHISNNNNLKTAETYTKIGFLYWKIGKPRYAIKNFVNGAKMFEQLNKNKQAQKTYSNIGVVYTDLEEIETALQYFQKSLEIRRKGMSDVDIASGLIDVSYILLLLDFNDDAIKNLNEALALSIKANNTRLIFNCYDMLAQNYKKKGNVKKSKELLEKAESYKQFLAEESIKEEHKSEVIESQQEIARSKEEKRLAMQVYELQQKLAKQEKDSLNISLQSKQDSLNVAAQQAKQRQQAIKLLEQEQQITAIKIKEQEALEEKQRLTIALITTGLLLTLIIVIIMQRANSQRKKANNQLEQHNKEIDNKNKQLGNAITKIERQNKNITQSINYAQNIQKALLPKEEQLNDILQDAFIFFNPRDIVSGDFYWFKEVETMQNDKLVKKIIITAVDCTGHGVPGAFMSMIGFNLLDEIASRGIVKPDEILKELHKGIHLSLKQKETNNNDGMDMAICVIDKEQKTLEFAGAQNPLIFIQDEEVQQIKGDRLGIGGKNPEVEFTRHTLSIEKPTFCYIFSDGFIDQFGGTEGRKFMIKHFREFLFTIHNKPMSEQETLVNKRFKEWLGEKYQQIDDVLVIGFKI